MCFFNHTLIKEKIANDQANSARFSMILGAPFVPVYYSRCGSVLKQCYRVKYTYCGWLEYVTAHKKARCTRFSRIKSNYLSCIPYAPNSKFMLIYLFNGAPCSGHCLTDCYACELQSILC